MDALQIKLARKTLGLSQTAFGELLGAKLRTVQSWESGERNMPTVTALMLKQKLDAHNYTHIAADDTSTDYKTIEVKHLDGLTSSIMQVPLVNQYAYAVGEKQRQIERVKKINNKFA